MRPELRINWPIAFAVTAALIFVWSVQGWVAPLIQRPTTVEALLLQQSIGWGYWLLLLPIIARHVQRHPLEGRPTFGWVARFLIEGTLFVMLFSILAGTTRWVLGQSKAPSLESTIAAGFMLGYASNLLKYAAIYLLCQAVLYHFVVRDRDRRAARLEIDLARATLSNVQARLQPHFLFNTLNAIAALVRDNPRAAEAMIARLSDLLRASLDADPLREVPFAGELRLAEQYLDIERMRFQERLRVSVGASDEARLALVPHLVLQPLVENAIRHGIAPLERGGSIAIRAARSNGHLVVTVEDDGAGLGVPGHSSTSGSGIGLGGLRTRLEHLYGDAHRLELHSAATGGTRATLTVPYRSSLDATRE